MTVAAELDAFLNDQRPSRGAVVLATRYFIAQASGDKTFEEMYEELGAANALVTDEMLDVLESDPAALERAALAAIAAAWTDDATRDAVRNAMLDARAKLPVIEAGALAVAAMYAIYLLVTKGRKKRTLTVTRNADGSFSVEETEEWFGPGDPLRALAQALSPLRTEPSPLPPGETACQVETDPNES